MTHAQERHLARLARKGKKWRIERSRKGGLATGANRTPEQRSEHARKAVTVRWRNYYAKLRMQPSRTAA